MRIAGESLIENFIRQGVDATLLQAALIESQALKKSLINYLITKKIMPPKQLAQLIAGYFVLPYRDIGEVDLKKLPLSVLPSVLLKKFKLLPLTQSDELLEVGVVDPTCQQMQEEIKLYSNLKIKLVVMQYDQLIDCLDSMLIQQQYAAIRAHSSTEHMVKDIQVVDFVDHLLCDALHKKASDIHFEPYSNRYRIRFRVDGLLHEIVEPALIWSQQITTRLKIMSQLDIAEKRMPQDGRFSFEYEAQGAIDCRVSACPTLFGEKIVVRLLQNNQTLLAVDALGFDELQKKLFLNTLKQPQGLILVTGPTGSGKTITLYTALNILNQNNINISTVEDPVEMHLVGVNQVQVNNKAGLTFAIALRAFLRQDPDVLMVGEMRDQETADIAIKSAQTGHLVFSTLHTNGAAESITRLANMGVAHFNIADAVTLIVSQRLIRKLCPYCKKNIDLSSKALLDLGFEKCELTAVSICQPQGCAHCVKGYLGRTGVYELLSVTSAVKAQIMHGQLIQNRHTLYRAALAKVKQGITSLSEVQRVIGQ